MQTFHNFRTFALFALVALLAVSASAQTFTTLSLAATNSDRRVVVASATGITAPGNAISTSGIGQPSSSGQTILYIDGEAMAVLAVSGTQISVSRGVLGTKAKSHSAAAKVGIISAASFLDPVRAKADFYAQNTGAALASGTTVTPINPVTHVTGTTTIQTVTVPAAFKLVGGTLTLIPDGLWSTGTSGNVAIATTGVVSKALILTYDPVAAKWYPSY